MPPAMSNFQDNVSETTVTWIYSTMHASLALRHERTYFPPRAFINHACANFVRNDDKPPSFHDLQSKNWLCCPSKNAKNIELPTSAKPAYCAGMIEWQLSRSWRHTLSVILEKNAFGPYAWTKIHAISMRTQQSTCSPNHHLRCTWHSRAHLHSHTLFDAYQQLRDSLRFPRALASSRLYFQRPAPGDCVHLLSTPLHIAWRHSLHGQSLYCDGAQLICC